MVGVALTTGALSVGVAAVELATAVDGGCDAALWPPQAATKAVTETSEATNRHRPPRDSSRRD